VAGDSNVTGQFTFTVSGLKDSVTVPVGACSAAIALPAGTVTIAETGRTDTVLTDVSTSPSDRLVSRKLDARKARVTIVTGDVSNETLVSFTNSTAPEGTAEPTETPEPTEES